MSTPQLSPYLNFSGNCEEAMTFYKSVLGGDLQISRFSDYASPEAHDGNTPPDGIMHSSLDNGTLSFMASDGMPGRTVVFGDSVNMSVSGNDETQLTNFFNGLSAGGTVTVPLAKQVWGDLFGMFTDKFGINWLFNIGHESTETEV